MSRLQAVQAAVEYVSKMVNSLLDMSPQVVLGIGTGTTVAEIMEKLNPFLLQHSGKLVGIPTSFQSIELIKKAGMTLGSLSQYTKVDLAFDGADEVSQCGRFAIKGGGGALFMEKVVSYAALHFVIVIDESKLNDSPGELGHSWSKGIPIAVHPDACALITHKLDGSQLRMATSGKMGPVVSDQGHFIVDYNPNVIHKDLANLSSHLSSIPGLVEHGIFSYPDRVIVGRPAGFEMLQN